MGLHFLLEKQGIQQNDLLGSIEYLRNKFICNETN